MPWFFVFMMTSDSVEHHVRFAVLLGDFLPDLDVGALGHVISGFTNIVQQACTSRQP